MSSEIWIFRSFTSVSFYFAVMFSWGFKVTYDIFDVSILEETFHLVFKVSRWFSRKLFWFIGSIGLFFKRLFEDFRMLCLFLAGYLLKYEHS